MTTLLALASPELCAAALRQPVPLTPEDAVRIIGEGSTAMSLDIVCAPWDHDAEVAGLRAMPDTSRRPGEGDWLDWAGTVTGWLVATPDHRPVIGVVSGPLWLSATARREDPQLDPQDALDEASDFVAARVRTLCELGVAEVVVLERGGDASADPGAAAEAHTAVSRLGRHFGVPVTLAALDDRAPGADLGYERWVSPGASSGGLALASAASLRDGSAGSLDDVERVVTEYLYADVTPSAVRDAAGRARRG